VCFSCRAVCTSPTHPLHAAILEDVARYAQGFNPVTVVADNLTYVVQTSPVSEGVPTVGKTVMRALNLRRHFRERSTPKVDTTILRDVSFVLKPGESLLVLGPPRSGKSTLLQLLANRRRHGTVSGGVFMDGVPLYGAQQPRNWHRQVVYVSQEDQHLSRLTVRETFEFAFECIGPETVPRWKRREDISQVLDMLGLHHQVNTLVGGELLRGVSGGERKRVTIGVEFGRMPGMRVFSVCMCVYVCVCMCMYVCLKIVVSSSRSDLSFCTLSLSLALSRSLPFTPRSFAYPLTHSPTHTPTHPHTYAITHTTRVDSLG
jgi:ABC-type lipoprotein export system ATPase subunit